MLKRFSIFAFSGLGKNEHPYDTPTCLGQRRPSLGAKWHPPSILRARSWKIMEYLHPNKITTHAKNKRKIENRKINVETNSHGNKLSTRTNAFHQLFHQRQQPRT